MSLSQRKELSMSNVLVLKSSILATYSQSNQLADFFVE